MTREEFDALVKTLEESSQKNPQGYLARVVGLVLLAYGYLAFLIVFSVLLLVGTILVLASLRAFLAIKIGILVLLFAGGMIWAIVRGLWVRFDAPSGLRVTRAEAPRLFALLDELRSELQCSPFHHVLLVGDYNAAVVQLPRLGIFGWHRNYLLIGLPLMQSLDPLEFKAVLAHEFAHSSKGHGRFGNWLYRLRRSWARIMEEMEKQNSGGGILLAKFLEWYWPRFNAHAFVLARANEYEADACSVRLAGADSAARALMRLPVDSDLLTQSFWPRIFLMANTQKRPPEGVLSELAHCFKQGVDPDVAAQSLKQAFHLETNNGDTHPCLRDRLKAMGRLPEGLERGEYPSSLPPPHRSAAEEYLGDHAGRAAEKLSREWAENVGKFWEERHDKAQKLEGELQALEQVGEGVPSETQLWLKAQKLIELHDDQAALPVIEKILELNPKHVAANFVRGRQLLEKNDPAGVNFLETALEENPLITLEGCELLYGYYTREGRRDQLKALEKRVDGFHEEMALAQKERTSASLQDHFMPHELAVEPIEALREVLKREPDVEVTALVRKQVKHFSKSPCFILVLRLHASRWIPRSSEDSQNILNRVVQATELPGPFFAFIDEGKYKPVAQKIFEIVGSEVYRKEKAGS